MVVRYETELHQGRRYDGDASVFIHPLTEQRRIIIGPDVLFELLRERHFTQKDVGITEILVEPVFDLANALYDVVDLLVSCEHHKSGVRPSSVSCCQGLVGRLGGYIVVQVVVHLLWFCC